MAKKPNILFLGTHGQKNWGDELLLRTFIERLSPHANRIFVNSYAPSETAEYLEGYPVSVFDTKNDRAKLLMNLIKSDALVFGGGSVLKELYVAYGGQRYATLNTIDTLTRVAKWLGKPIYFCNIGVGPIETKHGINLAERIINRATNTTVRDSESFGLLRKMHIISDYQWQSDAVFSLSRSAFGLSNRKKTSGNKQAVIGVNLCRNIENNGNWYYFLDRLAEDLAAWCQEHPDTKFLGIPMQYDVSNNNDANELQNLAKMIRKKVPDMEFEILKPASVQDIADAIERCDVLLAERLHTLIMATVIGTPIVALEYDIKVKGIINDLELASRGVDINQEFGKGKILQLLEKAHQDDKEFKKELKRSYIGANAAASESFDQLLNNLKYN